MIELLILWNVAALRSDGERDNDFSSGAIAVWIMLQILLWPFSLFAILWKRVGWSWWASLVATGTTVTWGYWLWGENFYFSMGMLGMVAAACVVAYAVVND